MNLLPRLFRPRSVSQTTPFRLFPPSPPARHLLAALTTSLLLWLAYFPVAWGWLGWVALVPLLTLVRARTSGRRVFLYAWLGGQAFYTPALQWIRIADPRMYGTWAALAVYCSLYFPIALLLIRRLDRRTRLPLVLTVPLIWTPLEYFRAHFGTGFGWYLLGYTQHDFLPVLQFADLAGVYGVTFLLAAVNAVVFELLSRWQGYRRLVGLPELPGVHFAFSPEGEAAARPPDGEPRNEGKSSEVAPSERLPSLWPQVVAVAILVVGVLGYGGFRLSEGAFTPGPRVALIQGNLDQRLRNAVHNKVGGVEASQIMYEHYQELTSQALAESPRPDLMVWPETSFPEEWKVIAPDLPKEERPDDWLMEDALSRKLVLYRYENGSKWFRCERPQPWPTAVLLGIGSRVLEADGASRKYNSALLVQPDVRDHGRYDKIHRVPFGEYVPLVEWLPWMRRFAPYENDYTVRPGRGLTRFTLRADREYVFGVVICYEDTNANLARQFGRRDDGEPLADRLHRWLFQFGHHWFPVGTGEPDVDFLVNISNDGWFDGSSEHQEHLAICRFRAVECRRCVARAVNMGISAVIDGNGRIVALPGPTWAASKKVEAVVAMNLPIDRRRSGYAHWGDWLPWLCGLMLAMTLFPGPWARPPKTRSPAP